MDKLFCVCVCVCVCVLVCFGAACVSLFCEESKCIVGQALKQVQKLSLLEGTFIWLSKVAYVPDKHTAKG